MHWLDPNDGQAEAKMNLLLSRGAHINSRDAYGMTPLHKFIYEYSNNPRGYGTLIIQLLRHGADVNLSGQGGVTPLMSAIDTFDLVDMLVKNGANINGKDESNASALDKAREIRATRVERYLIAHGAN